MIGGQYLDITGAATDLAALHRLKTGCLFSASVACALWVAAGAEREQRRGGRSRTSSACSSRSSTTSSTATATCSSTGADGARALADEAAERAQAPVGGGPGETSSPVSRRACVSGLAARGPGRSLWP